MAKIKEMKISIHRKYTKDYQSYGYRIGVMLDVGNDDPRSVYYESKVFLNERIKEEDLAIKNIVDKRDAEKGLGYKELDVIPEKKVSKSDSDDVNKLGDKGDGDKWIQYDVRQIKSTSLKAVLVELFGKKGDVWIPKSCVKDGDALDLFAKGEKTMLYVKNWFLEKSGLV